MKETSKKAIRYEICFVSLAVALFAAVIANIWVGSAQISFGDVFKILFTREFEGKAVYTIIWNVRLPRLCAAALLGGALGISGYLMQTYFRNPIASPFELGISSGAKLILAFCMVFAAQWFGGMSGVSMVLASFLGSLISMGFVLLCAGRTKSMAMLLVIGVMIGYICSALTDLVITFAKDEEIVNLTQWSMGTFSGTDWDEVLIIFVSVGLGLLGALFLIKPISAFQLGEGYAQSMGMNVRLFRVLVILLSSLLSACVVAFAGPVSFVGIAVPHLTKKMFATSRPSLIVPGTFLLGALFCLVCDLIARTLLAPTELAIGPVTAIFGAPVVITMLLRRRRNEA